MDKIVVSSLSIGREDSIGEMSLEVIGEYATIKISMPISRKFIDMINHAINSVHTLDNELSTMDKE